ncbi:MAG: carboxylesterase family protein [Deltaproteobacteria bacterium]|jgi:para-nitrobenzyl esterase|nr:carboxylesterase family protein [Deltaproteobacteria bacterium]
MDNSAFEYSMGFSSMGYSFLGVMVLAAAVVFFMVFTPAARADNQKEVNFQPPAGPVIGLLADKVISFKGIPYAKGALGDLRFAPPADLEPWTEPFKAFKFGPACYQELSDTSFFGLKTDSIVSEDCLNLNIYLPEGTKSGDNLAVYVFIHGGGFGIGSGSQDLYDGSSLAKEGLVVVTLNYRLAASGFLASKHLKDLYGTTGNWGLLDQIKALKWVRDNISAFGGDPEKVTIGGESAGAISVSALITSPLSSGLFRGAIMESGSVFTLKANPPSFGDLILAQDQAKLLLASLRLTDDAWGIKAARALDPKIFSRISPFNPELARPAAFSLFPVIDGKVIPFDIQKVMKAGQHNKVKLLLGFNQDEGSIFIDSQTEEDPIYNMVATTFGPKGAEEFWRRFPVTEEFTIIDRARLSVKTSFFSAGMKRFADLHSDHADVYFYRFEYVGKEAQEAAIGAYHTSELPFVFGIQERLAPLGPSGQKLKEEIQSRWVNFIKTGSPNEGLRTSNQIASQIASEPTCQALWPKYDPSDPKVMRFGQEVCEGPLTESLDLDFVSDLIFID